MYRHFSDAVCTTVDREQCERHTHTHTHCVNLHEIFSSKCFYVAPLKLAWSPVHIKWHE